MIVPDILRMTYLSKRWLRQDHPQSGFPVALKEPGKVPKYLQKYKMAYSASSAILVAGISFDGTSFHHNYFSIRYLSKTTKYVKVESFFSWRDTMGEIF